MKGLLCLFYEEQMIEDLMVIRIELLFRCTCTKLPDISFSNTNDHIITQRKVLMQLLLLLSNVNIVFNEKSPVLMFTNS